MLYCLLFAWAACLYMHSLKVQIYLNYSITPTNEFDELYGIVDK